MITEKAKPATVRPVGGLQNCVGFGGLNGSEDSDVQRSRQEFVMATLRSASLRVRLIDNEIAAAGNALKGGMISPEAALEWVEEVAPGCIGFIPEAAGLRARAPSEAA